MMSIAERPVMAELDAGVHAEIERLCALGIPATNAAESAF